MRTALGRRSLRIALILSALVLVGGVGYVFGCQEPVRIYLVHDAVRSGMTMNEVDVALAEFDGLFVRKTLLDDDGASSFCGGFQVVQGEVRPFERVAAGCPPAVEITVLLMGPGFLHNDFQVRTDDRGRVVSVSDVRHWD